MDPKRAARLLASTGLFLLLAVLLVRILSLISTRALLPAHQAAPNGQANVPILGHYQVSEDGSQVRFEQQVELSGTTGWFRMPVEGGLVTPVDPPPADPRPFAIRYGQLLLMTGDGTSFSPGSPPGMQVSTYTLSPDGKSAAFAAYRDTGQWGLYILNTSSKLTWLGDEDSLGDLAWSPDGQVLAYVAQRSRVDQVVRVNSDGQDQRQLTDDASRKSSPRWSPDGLYIAYLRIVQRGRLTTGQATPTPVWPVRPPTTRPQIDVYFMRADGSEEHQITRDGQYKFNLAWASAGEGLELLFSRSLEGQPQTTYLYAVAPETGQMRQVYPHLAVQALECPRQIPADGSGTIRLELNNSGLSQADLPLLVRSGDRPFSLTGSRSTGRIQAQTVLVPPGAVEVVELPVPAAPGLFTHVSALINLGEPFPMDEKHCTIPNTYFGLPNLPLLPWVLPLTALGMLLCIPWLRHTRKRWMRALWGLLPGIILAITAYEAMLVWGL